MSATALSFNADATLGGYSATFQASDTSALKIHIEYSNLDDNGQSLIRVLTKNDSTEEYGLRAVVKNTEKVFDSVADFCDGEYVKIWTNINPTSGSYL